MLNDNEYLKGRGAQFNADNRFEKRHYAAEFIEGIDEPFYEKPLTQFIIETPKQIVSKVVSPDLPMMSSLNPYQGCEHGCIYCYARNTHEYWGMSAGLDFESKIVVKPNAAALLEKTFRNKNWVAHPISISGNTDCYQPAEKEYKITRALLETCLKYRNPVSIITKNALILRDVDVLLPLAEMNLLHVYISITTLDENLRLQMEPRTATAANRLKVIDRLSLLNIPVGVMAAPIIPGLNDHEIPGIIKAAADNGACNAGYTVVRLNGSVGELFKDWIHKNYPDKAAKVLHQIAECHGGKIGDSRFGSRMSGEGKIADAIKQMFRLAKKKYMANVAMPDYDLTLFRRDDQLSLF